MVVEGTATVDGIVTANLSATDNAVLDDIAADIESIKGYTDGIEGLLGGVAGFVPSVYDYISLSYTDGDLTGVVFKTGGSGGSTVSTLTLAYTAHVLQSVTKS